MFVKLVHNYTTTFILYMCFVELMKSSLAKTHALLPEQESDWLSHSRESRHSSSAAEHHYFLFSIYLATIAIVNIDTNEDEQLRMTSPGGATGLNLREDERMYFGGLPKAGRYRYEMCFHRQRLRLLLDELLLHLILFYEATVFCLLRPEVVLKSFSGCMKDIEVSRTPYNLLSSPDYTGLTKGCSIEVQSDNRRHDALLLLF